MNRRRQALLLCLGAAFAAVVEVLDELAFEMIHGNEFLQVQQFTFQQAEEVLNHRLVETVTLTAHALAPPRGCGRRQFLYAA